jgi:serine/threonine protein phosphatase PrpC
MEFKSSITIGKKRESQQDAFVNKIFSDYYGLFVVCDGMGGMNDGGQAALITCKTIDTIYSRKNVKHCIRVSDGLITKTLGKHSGTTVAVALIDHESINIYHAGDSRVYLIKDGKIIFRTKDHSLETELIDSGVDKLKASRFQNCITNFVGIGFNNIKIEEKVAKDADYVVLCTDGLNKHVSDERILDHVLKNGVDAASTLTELADSRGGSDNTVVTVVKIRRAK